MASNYPDGLSDWTPGAPWNDPEVLEEDFEITCSQSLSRTATVTTNNYIPGASGVDYEPDDEGGCYASAWHDDPDTSDTNWSQEYEANGYHTPLQLIQMFKEYLENHYNAVSDATIEGKRECRRLKQLIEECDAWTDDETEFIED